MIEIPEEKVLFWKAIVLALDLVEVCLKNVLFGFSILVGPVTEVKSIGRINELLDSIVNFNLGHELWSIIAVKFKWSFCVNDSSNCGLIESSNNSLQIKEAGEELRIEKKFIESEASDVFVVFSLKYSCNVLQYS